MKVADGRASRVPKWLLVLAAACALVVLFAYLRIVPDLDASHEDHVWESVFHRFAQRGLSSVFTNALGTYRPVCGGLILAEDALGLSYAAKHTLSALMYLGNLLVLGWLVARLYNLGIGVLAAAVAMTCLSADEVLVWLGGRCDLLWVSIGLLGSHFALTVLHAARLPIFSLLLATIACGAACLTKEPGVALPLLWFIYASRTGAARSRLWPTLAIAIACVALRTCMSDGLGSYVRSYVHTGPLRWAAQGLQALGTLSLGTGPDAGPLMLTLGAIPTLGALGWLVLQGRRTLDRLAILGAIGLVLGPCALLFASRTLYPAVVVLAGLVSVACVCGGPARRIALAVFLVWQMGSAAVSLASWQRGYVDRRAAIAALAMLTKPGERLLLLAPRSQYAGRPLGELGDVDVLGGRAIGNACYPHEQAAITRLRNWRPPQSRLETIRSPTHRARVRVRGPCRIEVSPLDLSCAGIGASNWVREALQPDGSSTVTAERSYPSLVFVHADPSGSLRRLDCVAGQ